MSINNTLGLFLLRNYLGNLSRQTLPGVGDHLVAPVLHRQPVAGAVAIPLAAGIANGRGGGEEKEEGAGGGHGSFFVQGSKGD